MWHWLLHLMSVSFWITSAALASDPSTGPTSNAEAAILWADSQSAFQAQKYSASITPLERLLARYPGYPDLKDYREIRYQLGKCYFETRDSASENKKTNQLLHAYLEGSGEHPHRLEALELIGRLQLREKNYDEAMLVALELGKTEDPSFKARSLTLKARALLGKGQLSAAKEIALSNGTLARTTRSEEILGEAELVQLEILIAECDVKTPQVQSEDEVRTQIQERGACLQESLVHYRELLNADDEHSAKSADEIVLAAYHTYSKACSNPPAPPPLVVDGKPKKRTPEQLKNYHSELSQHLRSIYAVQKQTALSFIKNWENENPKPSGFVLNHLKITERSLR